MPKESENPTISEKAKAPDESSKENVAFLTFDPWSHTGDALRRSFLLKLYYCLGEKINPKNNESEDPSGSEKPDNPNGPKDPKQAWKALEDKLLYEKQTVSKEDTQVFPPFGIFLSLAAALYVGSGWVLDLTAYLLPQYPLLQLSLFQNLIQFVASIALAALLAFQYAKKIKENPLEKKGGGFLTKIFRQTCELVYNKRSTESTTTTTRSEVMGPLLLSDTSQKC